MPDDRRSIGVRVRPNSHDFIRQLRQDLASKKYTFYVDVGAKTHPATTDVRAWAAGPLQKIHASVPVRANTARATSEMADWRRRQAGLRVNVPVHADTSAAVREIEALRAMARDITVKVKADTTRAAAAARRSVGKVGPGESGMLDLAAEQRALKRFAKNIDDFVRTQRPFQGVGDSLTKEITAALDKTIKAKPKIDVDTAPARKSMRDLLNDFQKNAPESKIKLQFDERFDYQLRKRLGNIKKEAEKPVKSKLELEIDDAKRQLMALEIQTRSRKLGVPIQYDPTDVKQMSGQLKLLRLREEANAIKLKVDLDNNAFVKVRKQMDQVSKQFGSFSMIRSLDVGPLNLGKPTGLVGTVSTLTILAGLLPGAVLGVTALSDALVRLGGAAALLPGLIGAVGASVATLTVGTKGVSDAFGAMFAMWDEGASQQDKASTKMVTAQNNYKNAVVDETRAQERVASARREALGELRSLNNELRGGVLNEAQALLDLQKARDRYAQGDFENNTDRLQALLDIQRAELNVSTSREDNIALQQRANDAQAKGVEGSDLVRDALDAQRRAADSVTQALEALNAGGAGATTAAQKFQDQLSQLSPNAQDFVMTIAGMKDELYDFRNSIQDTIFAGTGPAFADMFDNLLPVIQPGMQQIAQGLNQNLLQVFDTLESPEGQTIIERILGGTAEAQKALSGLIDPLIRGFGTLTAAGAEHMPQLVALMTRLADRFALFIDKADRSGALDEFLDKGIDALSDMVEIGVNLIQIVNDLSKAFGGNILTDIKNLTDQWHEFLSSEEGQRKLKDFIQEAKDLWAEWKPVLMEIPDAFAEVADAARRVLGWLLPTIEKILGVFNKIPGSIETIATVLIASKLIGTFSKLFGTIKGIGTLLAGLPALINKIPGVKIPPIPGLPGAGGAGGAGGGLGAALAPGVAAGAGGAVAGVVAALPFLAVGAGVAGQALLDRGQDVQPLTGDVGGSGLTPLDAPSIAEQVHKGGVAADAAALPGGIPQPGSAEALVTVREGVKLKNPAAIWISQAKTVEDWKKRYTFAATHPETPGHPFAPPDSYASGGYTNWGTKTGHLAELHGGEYVQPHPVVNHYGVDAMKAVHDKKAVISYAGGGMMPMANPNWEVNPNDPGFNLRGWVEGPYGRRRPPIGGALGPPPGISPPGWVPGMGPGGEKPGPNSGTGIGRSPWWGKIKRPKKRIHLYYGGGRVPSFQDGGYFDPVSGTWIDPSDPRSSAIQHGSSAQAPPQLPNQGSILGAVQQGISSGINTLGNVAQQGISAAQQGIGAAQGASDIGAFPNVGATGLGGFADIATGAAPGGVFPGPLAPAAPGLAPTPVNGFSSGLLSGLGIPGLGGSGQGGPGWGEGGPPVGLGGGESGFDIRNFGIGPGPPGSGPADWLKFTGETLGQLGSGLFGAFTEGILSGLGLSGISSYLGAGTEIGKHFLESGEDSKAQGPGAAETNAAVQDLLGVEGQIAENPAYPGVPNLPNVIDLSTGSAVPGGAVGAGLQANTARGKQVIQRYFPWATNIGGVRPDALKWHPSGLALDVMIPGAGGLNDPTPPEGLALGNQLHQWLQAHASELGIDYMMWQEKDHYNHIHVNFAPSGYGAGGANWGNWQAPSAPGARPPKVSAKSPSPPNSEAQPQPPKAAAGSLGSILDVLKQGTHDQGGWLMPGVSVVSNQTGKPELVVPSYQLGGLAAGAIIPPPRPPDIMQKVAPPPPPPAPKPPPMAPKAAIPPVTPTAPPPAPHQQGGPPGPAPTPQGPAGGLISIGGDRPATGVGPSETGMHLHPAAQKGITSGFATAGALAQQAASFGMMAATMGASGAAGGMGGMGGGGAGGISISGMFQQAGKIATNAANVAASFLVGNITGGTTANAYGVTQQGSVPSGGTKVIDGSNNQYGDIYTNNLDEYMKLMQRKEAQKSQAGLGRWGNA